MPSILASGWSGSLAGVIFVREIVLGVHLLGIIKLVPPRVAGRLEAPDVRAIVLHGADEVALPGTSATANKLAQAGPG